MTSNPIDEDGFHSIAWDDAPTRSQPRGILTDVSASEDGDGDDGEGGFETISPGSPVASTSGSTARDTDTLHERQYRDRDTEDVADRQQNVDWGGRWMSIEVRDPVKEHEGSKDMFVSYAVRTKVSGSFLPRSSIQMYGGQTDSIRQTYPITRKRCWWSDVDSRTLRSCVNISSRASRRV